MKPSPIQRNRLKTCRLGNFDMLKWNLTSKTFESATQTSKVRKATSKQFIFESVRRVIHYFLIQQNGVQENLELMHSPCDLKVQWPVKTFSLDKSTAQSTVRVYVKKQVNFVQALTRTSIKKTKKGENEFKDQFSEVVFRCFWPLEAGILNF